MSRRSARVVVYKASDGWRWRFARNGKVRADGGQGYSRLIDCHAGLWDSLGITDGGVEKGTDEGHLYRNTKRGHEVIRITVERGGKP